MTKKVLIVLVSLILYIGLLFSAVSLINKFPDHKELIVLIFGTVTIFIGYIFKPILQRLEEIINTPSIEKAVCGIYLFGLGGSGKTTLVKSWVSGDVDNKKETEDFKYYERKAIPINNKYIDAVIADYQGQNPAQIVANIIKNNALTRKPYTVNTLIFIVDIVENEDDIGNPLLTQNSQIQYLSSNPQQKIAARVEKHMRYIGGSALNFLFYFMQGPDLKIVKLIINKFDVISEIVNRGYIQTTLSNRDYAQKLFEELENVLSNICKQNAILSFDVHCVSAENHLETSAVLDDVIRTYEKYLARRKK